MSASPFSDGELRQIQSEFPHLGDQVYLNYASVGPLPARARRVIDAINDTFQRMDHNFDPETDRAAARARTAMARLVGGTPDQVGLLPNTSFGIIWALGLFHLKEGDRILISDHEFPALRYAAAHLSHRGIDLVTVPVSPSGGLDPDRLEEHLCAHPRVRVVATSWVSFHNGFRHDLAALAEVAHRHDAFFLVDGIQGIGTRPLDAPTAGVDVVASAVHKWLMCPVGLGFVWCRPELAGERPSPWAGWMSVEWGSEYGRLFGPAREMTRGPRAAEAGTSNFAGVRALAETGEWLLELGTDRIARHTAYLLDVLLGNIDRDRYDIVSDRSPEHASSIACLRPRSGDAGLLHRHLSRAGIKTSLREGAVRLSPHFPTMRSDIEQLAQSLHEFLPA